MNVQIDENDLKVLIGIAAYLTAHVATGRSGAVTLDMIDGRLARDLRRFGLAEDDSSAAVEEAMSHLTSRLHAALDGSRPDQSHDRRVVHQGEAFSTPLHRAAIDGDAAAVRAAIREGMEVNAIDSNACENAVTNRHRGGGRSADNASEIGIARTINSISSTNGDSTHRCTRILTVGAALEPITAFTVPDRTESICDHGSFPRSDTLPCTGPRQIEIPCSSAAISTPNPR